MQLALTNHGHLELGKLKYDSIEVDEQIYTKDSIWIEGNNILLGTNENDIHRVNFIDDFVLEKINGGNDTVLATTSYELCANVENLILEDNIKRETINNVNYLIYGLSIVDENRWNFDYDQTDSGVVKKISKDCSEFEKESENYKPEKYVSFNGCCSVVAIENLLIMAGVIKNKYETYETNIIYDLDYTTPTVDLRQDILLSDIIKENECNILGLNPEKLGAIADESDPASASGQIVQILNRYGISSTRYSNKIFGTSMFLTLISESIKNGKGVMLSIISDNLWNDTEQLETRIPNHMILAVGVKYEEGTNNIAGFYIVDSGFLESEFDELGKPQYKQIKYVPLNKFVSSIAENSAAIITNEPIRNVNNNTYGIGNELNNEIKGNSGNNILIGNAGDDKLYGGDGKDLLFGGSTSYTIEELQNLMQIGVTKNADWSKFEFAGGNFNTLEGGNGNDILIASSVYDTLKGGRGLDTLVVQKGDFYYNRKAINGGEGFDTYIIGSEVENIWLQDDDFLGKIKYDGQTLRGANEQISEGFWMDQYGNSYQWDGVDGSNLIINYTIHINGFCNGNLSIQLGRTPDGNMGSIDPLVLDLDGDGVELISMENSNAYFDLNGDGIREKVQWVAPDDGLLVLDKNADGEINGIDELFGNPATIGFEDLKQYDINNDNVIDSNDIKYSQFRVWQDLNSDGAVSSDELKTLEELNIAKINLNYEPAEDTTFAEKSTIEFSDGTTSTVQDINLKVNFANTKYEKPTDIPEEICVLPQIEGAGKLRDLHTSMLTNTPLKDFVTSLLPLTPTQIYNSLDSLLKLWAGVNADNSEMRGLCPKYIVEVVEQYCNQKYSVVDRGTGELTSDVTRVSGVAAFKSNYKNIKNSVFSKFIIETGKYECFSEITYSPETKQYTLNTSETALNESIKTSLLNATEDDTIAIAIVLDQLRYSYAFDFDPELLGEDYSERQKIILSDHRRIGYDLESEYNDLIIASEDGMTFTDYSGSDVYITKNGDNTITDTQGSNEFYLGSGNDTVISESAISAIVKAGAGNDRIEVSGNSLYTKDNVAQIYGEDGNDNISVREVDDVFVSGGNDNDGIYVDSSRGNIEVYGDAGNDYIYVNSYNALNVVISGGEGDDEIQTNGCVNIYGDDGVDRIYINNGNAAEVSGGTGDDIIQAYMDNGSDIYGDEGNDTITIKNSESTTVSGGEGNDIITIENSSATVVFNHGDGEDHILFNQSETHATTLKFGPGITWDDLIFYTETITTPASWTSDPEYAEIANNLIIKFKNYPNDKITIKYWFGGQGNEYNSSYNYRFDSFEFYDGSSRSIEDIVISEYVPTVEDNVYTFNIGDKLEIRDYCGSDKIVFGEGITLEDLEFYRVAHGTGSGLDDEYWKKQTADDLFIKSSKFSGEIYITNYYTETFNNETSTTEYPHQIEFFEFTDGTIVGPDKIEELRIIAQTPGNDYIYDKGYDDIYNLVGNDIVYDTSGNDVYNSDFGNQNITDVETKNPLEVAEEYTEEQFGTYEAYETYLKTLLGNDSYNLGSGHDTIIDKSSGNDIINTGAGEDNITVMGKGTVQIDAGNHNDTVTVRDRENSYISTGQGNDTINLENTKLTEAFGGYGEDTMFMSNTTSSTLSGESGCDVIIVKDSENPIVYGGDDYDDISISGSTYININGDNGDDSILITGSSGGTVNGGKGEDTINIDESTHITINGGDNNDYIYVSNSEATAYGDSGNDILKIENNSFGTLSGGIGNDEIIINNSDAEILFNLGDGQDVVNINNDNNKTTLRFGEGITWDDLEFSYVSEILNPDAVANGEPAETSENMVIKIKNTDDQIVFKEWYKYSYGPKYYLDYIKFSDDTVYSIDDIPKAEFNGTDGDDTLTGTALNDNFNGKKGNDILIDRGGDDTYLFNLGDGQDIIKDEYGNDTLQFGDNITSSDVEFYRVQNFDVPENDYDEPGDDLLIKIKNTTDQILIKNYYKEIDSDIVEDINNCRNTIEVIKFADGTILNMKDVDAARIIPQTPGDDYIYGRSDDGIYNLEGNDKVIDTSGNDIYNSVSGNQYIVDSEITPYNKFDQYNSNNFDSYEDYEEFLKTLIGNDTYNLGSGNDTIIDTSNGNDVVHAGAGDDVISVKEDYYRKYGTAVVYGEAGDDTIEVEKVSATISGGTGNDKITVIETNTTFLFNRGDGQDIITLNNEDSNSCTLKFGEGITWEDLEFSKITEVLTSTDTGFDMEDQQTSESMVIKLKGSDDQITVRFWFGGENTFYYTTKNNKIDYFEFADGTVYQKEDILLELMNRSYVEGTDANDNIYGTAKDDVINAKKGNDTIVDNNSSNDYYIFNSGDGQDIIRDYGGNDIISFGEGISKNDIVLTKNNNDLIISIKNSTDKITIENWSNGYDYQIETLKFSDGSTMTNLNSLINNFIGSDSDDTITGNTLDNIIDGGKGSDTMIGDIGNDTYIVDNVNDKIIEYANEGIDSVESSVTYTLPDNVENITLSGTENINATGNREDNIITGNSGDNLLHGNIGNDILYGGAGKDILYGDQNDDILVGGTGNDTMLGGSGNDTYLFEENDGVDIINDLSGDKDCVHFGSTIDKNKIAIFKSGDNLIVDYGNSLGKDKFTVLGQFSDTTTKEMERFELSDGSYLDINDINKIIENMTTYAQNNSIEFTNISSVKNNADLMNLVASAWHC